MLHDLQEALGATTLAPFVRDVVWVKVALEVAHILADALILASIALMATRLWFGRANEEGLSAMVRRLRPWLWCGLAVAVITGAMLLTGAGRRGLENPMFAVKLAAMAIAVVATAWLQAALLGVAEATVQAPARRAMLAIGVSFCLAAWMTTVFAGRLLAYAGAFFVRY